LQPLIYSILTDIQITVFERHWELDFSYSLPGVSRFRVNVHKQRGSVGSVFRMIPSDMPTLDKLRMPPIVRELTQRPRGLVLVTGPTGSGKSTTLAAMIDEINRTVRTHIVTVEDPIEFLHSNKMSVITQREVGSDTESFSTALRHVLRQDPDVILIGEMRDLETIAAALTAAETGHLVFATLHTTSAAQSIDRIVDVFPSHQQDQVRIQLANVLEGIATQALLRSIDGKGRVCAQEILIASSAIRSLIRDNKVHQMPSVMQASAKYGMQTLDQCLRTLVLEKKVTLDEAIAKSSSPEDFKALLAMQ
jgi:twitching motility protein PilT